MLPWDIVIDPTCFLPPFHPSRFYLIVIHIVESHFNNTNIVGMPLETMITPHAAVTRNLVQRSFQVFETFPNNSVISSFSCICIHVTHAIFCNRRGHSKPRDQIQNNSDDVPPEVHCASQFKSGGASTYREER